MPARRRRRVKPGRLATPYLLLIPALVVIGRVLGYPLYRLVTLSFQEYGLPELIAHKGQWIGLDNYQRDPRRPLVLDRARQDDCVHRRHGRPDDALRDADRAPARAPGDVHAPADHDRARARVVDAARRRGEHLELDGRLRVRRPQLDAGAARLRVLRPPRLVRQPDRRAGRSSPRSSSGARSPSSRSRSSPA